MTNYYVASNLNTDYGKVYYNNAVTSTSSRRAKTQSKLATLLKGLEDE